MASITANTPTENKLFIENYNILQESKEDSEYTNLTHNYHTVDLVTGELSSVSRRELVTALNIDRSGSMADSVDGGEIIHKVSGIRPASSACLIVLAPDS